MILYYDKGRTIVKIDDKSMYVPEAILKFPKYAKQILEYSKIAKKLGEKRMVEMYYTEQYLHENASMRETTNIPESWNVAIYHEGNQKIKSFPSQQEAELFLKNSFDWSKRRAYVNDEPISALDMECIKAFMNGNEYDPSEYINLFANRTASNVAKSIVSELNEKLLKASKLEDLKSLVVFNTSIEEMPHSPGDTYAMKNPRYHVTTSGGGFFMIPPYYEIAKSIGGSGPKFHKETDKDNALLRLAYEILDIIAEEGMLSTKEIEKCHEICNYRRGEITSVYDKKSLMRSLSVQRKLLLDLEEIKRIEQKNSQYSNAEYISKEESTILNRENEQLKILKKRLPQAYRDAAEASSKVKKICEKFGLEYSERKIDDNLTVCEDVKVKTNKGVFSAAYLYMNYDSMSSTVETTIADSIDSIDEYYQKLESVANSSKGIFAPYVSDEKIFDTIKKKALEAIENPSLCKENKDKAFKAIKEKIRQEEELRLRDEVKPLKAIIKKILSISDKKGKINKVSKKK